MQAAMGEVDGVPAQRDQLGRPQPVPVGDQHHGGIAVAVAILPGGGDQAIDLAIGEVLAGADLGVALAARRAPAIANCPNNGGWRHQRQMRICHDFLGLFPCYCPVNMAAYGTLRKGKNADFTGTTVIPSAAAEHGRVQEDTEVVGLLHNGHHRSWQNDIQSHNGGLTRSHLWRIFFGAEAVGARTGRRGLDHRAAVCNVCNVCLYV